MNAPHPIVAAATVHHPSGIPKYIHRTLLYDNQFPNNVLRYLKRFYEAHPDYIQVLWRRDDAVALMSETERQVYFGYEKNVQRADFARYIILREVGGMYVDFDIDIRQPLAALHDQLATGTDAAFFSEHSEPDSHFEYSKWFNYREGVPESRLRVGQAVMLAKPKSRVMTEMVELCIRRSVHKVLNQDDVLFTTGPDVARTIVGKHVEENDAAVVLYDWDTTEKHFEHVGTGHWRGF